MERMDVIQIRVTSMEADDFRALCKSHKVSMSHVLRCEMSHLVAGGYICVDRSEVKNEDTPKYDTSTYS